MPTPDEMRRLAADAVQAGRLPNDPSTPFTATMDEGATCSVCAQPVGRMSAFRLISPDGTFVLHAPCFSAWVDVVVTPTPQQ